MNRDEALAIAERWILECRGEEFRIDQDSVFRTRDGWEIGYAVPGKDGKVRAGGRWPRQGVEVHVLGTTAVIEDGSVKDRPWEARFDPELISMPGMRTDPDFTAVAGWTADGEFHPNPARVAGPIAAGDPLPLTPMERFLDYVGRGWYGLDQLGHNGVHGEVLIPGEVPATRFDYPETLPVFTRPDLLPAGTAVWTRVALNTFISKVFAGDDFSGTRPQHLHINPGLSFDTELRMWTFVDEAAQHLRMCGCAQYGAFKVERSPWLSRADIATLDHIVSSGPVHAVPVRTVKVEFTLGVDEQGRRFVVREREAGQDNGKLRGCLIGGAIGDALGANTENLPMEVVYERHGPQGITDLPDDPAITDDTQMTLFTFEAMIRGHVRERTTGNGGIVAVVQHAYQRWLHTQKTPWEKARGPLSTLDEPDGRLIGHRDLFRLRAPGLTVTSALQQYGRTGVMATAENPANDSKGCGGVMRVAPIAFYADDASQAFALAKCAAGLTHGHPSGYLSAGFFAVLVWEALRGKGLLDGVDTAMKAVVRHEGHEEVVAAVEHAIELAALGEPSVARVEELGGGGVGDTALAIALYSALVTDDPNEALLISVNHGGDNDSTASLCGNLVGALHGVEKIRPDWVERVQFRDVIDEMVADWETETGPNPPMTQEWFVRYPPS
ncbi:ADP-ribosylglycohydrolase family protein [Lentzea albidocapillata]|uniref:ADP-ribosylglycohydrolase n=1 Tax=Lentzea albidocapillata TaxID=40571 RepID=A0A1W2FI04_9PSEU|nr:ADP-ribosylglycohydrolase family protein [Lentzea albidocapillata]SMD21354.1 ADP-ribosylglycohydrolase [Lentzea albidocapillata]